jgi:hypothetical protein
MEKSMPEQAADRGEPETLAVLNYASSVVHIAREGV